MTIRTAEQKIKAAMTVIVDGVLGENSNPKESCQSKYRKVDAINDSFISSLRENLWADGSYADNIVRELLRLSKHIQRFNSEHSSYLIDRIEPERWMFKLMK